MLLVYDNTIPFGFIAQNPASSAKDVSVIYQHISWYYTATLYTKPNSSTRAWKQSSGRLWKRIFTKERPKMSPTKMKGFGLPRMPPKKNNKHTFLI